MESGIVKMRTNMFGKLVCDGIRSKTRLAIVHTSINKDLREVFALE
jgi:hypothetical protein